MSKNTVEDGSGPEISFFADPQLDQVVGLVFTLAMEVAVLSARLRAVEGALGEAANKVDPLDLRGIAEREALLDRLLVNLRASGTKARPLFAERLAKGAGKA